MRAFTISPRDGVQRLDMELDAQNSVFSTLGRGAPWMVAWTPVPVRRLVKARETPGARSLADFTTVAAHANVPVLSGAAKAAVAPLLGDSAQWLPLAFDEAEYWLLNLLRVVDALDAQHTVMRRFADGRVISIDAYALQPQALAGEWLFKVAAAPYDVLATEAFRDLVTQQRLTGLHFHPVWDDAHAAFRAWPGRDDVLARPEVFGPEGFVGGYEALWPVDWKRGKRGKPAEAPR